MKKVLLDPELRAGMIERGIERAKAFGWEQCARQVLAVFDALAPSATPATSLATAERSQR